MGGEACNRGLPYVDVLDEERLYNAWGETRRRGAKRKLVPLNISLQSEPKWLLDRTEPSLANLPRDVIFNESVKVAGFERPVFGNFEATPSCECCHQRLRE